MAESTTYKVVGTRPIRHDGVDKVTGRAIYGADVQMAGLLHGKVLRSPHAHARIRSIDVSRALALPGVKAVVTSASEIPPATADRPAVFSDDMPLNALMMPTVVPNRPTNGAVAPMVARPDSPRFSSAFTMASAPRKMSASTTVGSFPAGNAVIASAVRGSPPIAYTSDSAFAAATRPKSNAFGP